MPRSFMTVAQSLAATQKPHLFLLNIGLSDEDYKATGGSLTADQKKDIAQRVIAQASDEEVLKIIAELSAKDFRVHKAELSAKNFRVNKKGELRSDSCLVVALIDAYVHKHEADPFNKFYNEQIKQRKTIADYQISAAVQKMWGIVRQSADNELDGAANLRFTLGVFKNFLPVSLASTLTPSPDSDRVNRSRFDRELSNLGVLEAFHDNNLIPCLIQRTTPALADNIQSSMSDVQARLKDIETLISKTNWKVGNYLIFKGGVEVDVGGKTKRLPHRVSEILDLIHKARDKSVDDKKEAYREILGRAEEAINSPRSGRDPATTKFYQAILRNEFLQQDYTFNPSPS